jgi:protein-disulfide isomerase
MQLRCSRRIWILGMVSTLGSSCAPPRPPVPVPANAPRKGSPAGRLVLQEIGDYECPFCAEVQPAVKQLLATHPDITLVWRNYPLHMHPHAELAAEAAVEVKTQVGDDGFWRYHDTLFQNQAALDPDALRHYATTIAGIDIDRFVSALRAGTHRAVVEADRRAIEDLQLPSMATPAFLFQGDYLIGAYPYPAFAGWIDDRI